MTKLFAAAGISLLLLSCGTQQMYEGQRQALEQVALLKPGSPSLFSFDPELGIEEIDGNQPRRFTLDTATYELLPGLRRIKATLVDLSAPMQRTPSKVIQFEAKAGESYTIFYRWRNRREVDWILYVKEDRTGNVIAEQ